MPNSPTPGDTSQQTQNLCAIRRLDIAFFSHAFLALSIMAVGAVSTFATGLEQAGYAMLLLSLPVPMLAALIVAIVMTVQSRRYRPLLAVGMIHILFVAVFVGIYITFAGEPPDRVMNAVIWSYGLAVISGPVWWWLAGGRQRRKDYLALD